METTKLFDSGNSQAIRLPKKYQIKGKEAFITKIGDAIVIIPMKQKWNLFIGSLDKFSDDFLTERTQPSYDKRDELF
jgi:antitoxin VapB